MSNGEIILYTTEDGKTSIKLRAEENTVWLTRMEIAELFQTTPQNITLQGVYEENEADIDSTSKDCLLVQKEGNRNIQREIKLYNLSMILAIGYRVRSPTTKRNGMTDMDAGLASLFTTLPAMEQMPLECLL